MSASQPDGESKMGHNLNSGEHERAHMALAERAAKIGYWRHDVHTGQTTRSQGMYHILGVDPHARHDDKGLLDRIIAEDREILNAKLMEAIKTRKPFYYRSRIKNPDGTLRIVETHGEVEFGDDKRVSSVIGVCQDITDRVATESARQRAEDTYKVMAEQSSDIIILYNSKRQVIYASEALRRVLKRTIQDISNLGILEIVHPDDVADTRQLAIAPGPGKTITITHRVRHGDGHYVWMEATSRGIYDETGELQNIVITSRDITERKRLEFETAAARDRAEAANLAKSTFLANMSHELRTPLNAIIGFADIMQQNMFGPLGSPRYDEYTRLIFDSGELLLDLISDVLDMAKIEAGKLELHVQEVDLKQLVHDCIRLLDDRAQNGGITLKTELPEARLMIEGDRRALKQILLNLLSNATKFTPEGGTVAVRATIQDKTIVLAVSDDGIGIPAADLPRLGRPFEQVTNDPTLSKGGTGLGLALVCALAAKHGGKARIESEEGIGTTVTVELPIRQDARAAA